MKRRSQWVVVCVVVGALFLLSPDAQAYVGPGAGLGLINSLIGLVLAMAGAMGVLFRGVARKTMVLLLGLVRNRRAVSRGGAVHDRLPPE